MLRAFISLALEIIVACVLLFIYSKRWSLLILATLSPLLLRSEMLMMLLQQPCQWLSAPVV
jgi:hypothetical protein